MAEIKSIKSDNAEFVAEIKSLKKDNIHIHQELESIKSQGKGIIYLFMVQCVYEGIVYEIYPK